MGESKTPLVIAISGTKNTGKTTLLTKLIPLLRQRGVRVAAIKHDHHGFDIDLPGTDSYRLREAGAMGVAIYSEGQYAVIRRQAHPDIEQMLAHFSDMDLVLLEGGKHTSYPKIEIVRKAVSISPVCQADTLIGLCTDCSLSLPGVPRYTLEDYDGMAQLIMDALKMN
ncbi:molybdopterin-guanine dinucleotide biosynthesis protein B [Ruminococcaceae bacterium OttesenSCG-928-A11]|nr:molybdopterin-guanine dinucleotide biosynthesis protein B [Ruminococcaceae bacterium OttesenSCG-928-A11]